MIYGVDYIAHGKKGWTKRSHKYISRHWKNGKWIYVYTSPAKQSIELNSNGSSLDSEQIRKLIKKETRDAEERYRKAYYAYEKANRDQSYDPIKLAQLRRTKERLAADYKNTLKVEKAAINDALETRDYIRKHPLENLFSKKN